MWLTSPQINPFIYPAGTAPGFDPNHIASIGLSRKKGFSGIASNGNIVSLLDGSTGTVAGAPAAGINNTVGPATTFTNTADTISFVGNSTAAATSITFAGIVWFNALNAATVANCIISTNTNFNSAYLNTSGASWTMEVNNTEVSSAIVPTINTPYFFIMSSLAATNVNFLFLNLANGKLITKTVATAASAAAPTATVWLGNNGFTNVSPMLGSIAAIMYAPKRMSMQAMLTWAADPWSFWYPRQDENWTSVVSAAVASAIAWGRRLFLLRMEDQ